MMKRFFFGLVSVAFAVGCGSSTDSGTGGSGGGSGTCPSYTGEVAALVTTYCGACHGAGSALALDTQANVAAHADKVKSELASDAMPPAGSTAIPAADEATIVAWITCGAPNN